ncbi:fungal-specific transcription factor domain-containing protein [Dichotomopilus funicola]|uniref:Fungal-specific transcription factor domain-containing protein n=1 Tax=Dichotomopilus funicola TaxID=1934379 RepID=A0AAN6ZJ69_9PEZI|nr:fungal-specific transcription factor domain-containing protein [Dichotomopilus funicola]
MTTPPPAPPVIHISLSHPQVPVQHSPSFSSQLPFPRLLSNGIPLPPRSQHLLSHFANNILASLSCHPSIHADFRDGLIPATLASPPLLSACLALAAAGLLSRGVMSLDGVATTRVLEHLESSGLALLRETLGRSGGGSGGPGGLLLDETAMATCLVWCLADVFAFDRGAVAGENTRTAGESTSNSTVRGGGGKMTRGTAWRIHLRGIRALLDREGPHRDFRDSKGKLRAARRHLYQLYLALRTLPYIPASEEVEDAEQEKEEQDGNEEVKDCEGGLVVGSKRLRRPRMIGPEPVASVLLSSSSAPSSEIDGFLGYSDELLDVIRQIDHLSRSAPFPVPTTSTSPSPPPTTATTTKQTTTPISTPTPIPTPADTLLTHLHHIIARDTAHPPTINIPPPITPSYTHEFTLCHYIFLQSTLIHLHRRLYHLPSSSPPIRTATNTLTALLHEISSIRDATEPCHTWVAMAMPLFTLGCEVVEDEGVEFVLEGLGRLEGCVRSGHVGGMRRALGDVWRLRREWGDWGRGEVCAGVLLGRLDYHVVLF